MEKKNSHNDCKWGRNPDDFSVLTCGSSEFQLKIKKSLLISKDKPVLKKAVSSLPVRLFLGSVLVLFASLIFLCPGLFALL